MSRSLIVLPDDSAWPILDAINEAKKSLRIKMFVLSDPSLLQALFDAHDRGVKIRVMLNPARRNGKAENEVSREALCESGIEVLDSNPAFDVTHEKSMVVDDTTGFIKSLNWEPKNFTETRDYAVITQHAQEVNEMIECFEADWHRQSFEPGKDSHLIWCKGNGRERIAQLIDDAKHTLFIQNERYQDAVIIERLVRANARGVRIHIFARPPHTLKIEKLVEGVGGLRIMRDVGIKIRKLKHLKLHAKMLLADGTRAIIGSINLAPGSFDSRRELAVEVRESHILERLQKVVHHDWENSHPLDLTDEGLLSDLDRHHVEAESLVLERDGKHHNDEDHQRE